MQTLFSVKTILVVWFSTSSGVATNSVQSFEFDSVAQCEGYAQIVMADKGKKAEQYFCVEGYSLSKKGGE